MADGSQGAESQHARAEGMAERGLRMKLCKDCKHYRRAWFAAQYSTCAHPRAVEPVSGKATRYCTWIRDRERFPDEYHFYNGICGPKAELFEQRVAWWRR